MLKEGMRASMIHDGDWFTTFVFSSFGSQSYVHSYNPVTGEQGEKFKQDAGISRMVIDAARKDPNVTVIDL